MLERFYVLWRPIPGLFGGGACMMMHARTCVVIRKPTKARSGVVWCVLRDGANATPFLCDGGSRLFRHTQHNTAG